MKLSTAKDGGVPPRSKVIFELAEKLKIETGVLAEAKENITNYLLIPAAVTIATIILSDICSYYKRCI